MNFALTQIEATGHGWRNGVYYYAVSAKVDGKRETLKLCATLAEAIEFHKTVNAYVEGTYNAEVFDALNAIAQERAEG